MIVNWAFSSLQSDASQSSAARQAANTSHPDSATTTQQAIYQNVTVNNKPNDPFGDFEEALRKTSKIRIKKVEYKPSLWPNRSIFIIIGLLGLSYYLIEF